MTKQIRSESSQ